MTLQAIADAFGLRINVLTSYPEDSFKSITSAAQQSNRILWVSFWAEVDHAEHLLKCASARVLSRKAQAHQLPHGV